MQYEAKKMVSDSILEAVALPSFLEFDSTNSKFVINTNDIFNTGTYEIMLYGYINVYDYGYTTFTIDLIPNDFYLPQFTSNLNNFTLRVNDVATYVLPSSVNKNGNSNLISV